MAAVEQEIAQARESNADAEETLNIAQEEYKELMNEYVKPGSDSLAEACQKVATPFSTGNIFFGRKKTKVPRDDTFETCTGQKLKRKPLAEYIQEIVINAAQEEGGDWKKSSNSNGVLIEYSPSRSIEKEGATFYRAKATLKVAPKELLLTQIRSSVVGKADDSVQYMREHYAFADGRSFLIHNVRKALPKILGLDVFQLRDFFDFTHWEDHDGTIIFSSQSVNLPANIRNCTRGDNLIFGIMMKPIVIENDDDDEDDEKTIHTEATLVTQFRANGWSPGKLVDAFTPRGIGNYLKNVEKAAIELREAGVAGELISKYIDLEP